MSIFSGQFGSFGGGYITGPKGLQTHEGGPLGAMAHAPMVQEVQIGQGAVVYQASTAPAKVRQPGRQVPKYHGAGFSMPVGPSPSDAIFGGQLRQGRY